MPVPRPIDDPPNTDHGWRAQGYTPLHLAVFYNQSAVILRLMEKAADIKAKNKVPGYRPTRAAFPTSFHRRRMRLARHPPSYATPRPDLTTRRKTVAPEDPSVSL
jgi:ankyrin repeat protein